VGKMRLVRLVRLSPSSSSNVCNSPNQTLNISIYPVPISNATDTFPYSKPNNTCPKRNRHGSSVSVIFTQNNATDRQLTQPSPAQTLALTLILSVTLSLILSLMIILTLIALDAPDSYYPHSVYDKYCKTSNKSHLTKKPQRLIETRGVSGSYRL